MIPEKHVRPSTNSDDDFVVPASPRKSRSNRKNVLETFEKILEEKGVSKQLLGDPM